AGPAGPEPPARRGPQLRGPPGDGAGAPRGQGGRGGRRASGRLRRVPHAVRALQDLEPARRGAAEAGAGPSPGRLCQHAPRGAAARPRGGAPADGPGQERAGVRLERGVVAGGVSDPAAPAARGAGRPRAPASRARGPPRGRQRPRDQDGGRRARGPGQMPRRRRALRHQAPAAAAQEEDPRPLPARLAEARGSRLDPELA
ncbi:unnamed protein product, partial [Prorocentrum cordatum]